MSTIKSKDINKLFKLSRQRLRYWRKIGLISSNNRTEKGYYIYDYQDLVALKTIEYLRENNFTISKIRRAFEELKKRYPDINPFVQKSIITVGNRIGYIEGKWVYDAIDGQGFLINNSKRKAWIKKLQKEYPRIKIDAELKDKQLKSS